MTRHYCDRCQRERDDLIVVKIVTPMQASLGDELKFMEFCAKCWRDLRDFLKTPIPQEVGS